MRLHALGHIAAAYLEFFDSSLSLPVDLAGADEVSKLSIHAHNIAVNLRIKRMPELQ
ncbi:MAG TPA: hypothetical protein VGK64_21050 [Bryobacteraceae bacterium]